jgi:hypothetical protein
MANFEFSVDDLLSDDSAPFKREQTKDFPISGQPVRTSASVYQQRTHDLDSPAQLSTLDAGQIMMGVPLYANEADIVGNQEYMMSNLLGAASQGEDPKKPSGLYDFDYLTPSDIKMDVANNAIISAQAAANGSTGPNAADGTAGQPGTGGVDPGASADGQKLIANPNVKFQGTAGASLAKDDISAGRISPNVIFALSILASQMGFTISCAASDLSGHRNQGHAANSLHYQFRAVDIVDLVDLKTNKRVHIADDRYNPLIRQALDILNTITGPRRPDQVISLINTGYPGFFSAADHWNHIHLGDHTWGDPAPPQPAPRGLA